MNYIAFFELIGRTKKILRTGYVKHGIKDPESIADHSFRTALLALVLADKIDVPVNREKVLIMSLIHDIGEVFIGDVIIQQGNKLDISARDKKEQKERTAIKDIFSLVGEGDKYLKLFDELVARKTDESKFVWECDKLERTIQAYEYEHEQKINLEEFFISSRMYMHHTFFKKIFNKIMQDRTKTIKKLRTSS